MRPDFLGQIILPNSISTGNTFFHRGKKEIRTVDIRGQATAGGQKGIFNIQPFYRIQIFSACQKPFHQCPAFRFYLNVYFKYLKAKIKQKLCSAISHKYIFQMLPRNICKGIYCLPFRRPPVLHAILGKEAAHMERDFSINRSNPFRLFFHLFWPVIFPRHN